MRRNVRSETVYQPPAPEKGGGFGVFVREFVATSQHGDHGHAPDFELPASWTEELTEVHRGKKGAEVGYTPAPVESKGRSGQARDGRLLSSFRMDDSLDNPRNHRRLRVIPYPANRWLTLF
jgi:hypothetical protein